MLFNSQGPWAAFDKWHLKDDYKKLSKKKELTESLKNRIDIDGIRVHKTTKVYKI